MSARSRLALDLALFAALLAAYNPKWTGMSVHEWLSLALVTPLLIHLIINWDWTVRVISTFFRKLLDASRLNLLVDSALFVATVAVMLSGFMVSTVIAGFFGISHTPQKIWVAVHAVSADMTILLLLVHFALHWKFVVSVIARMFRSTQPSMVTQPAPVRSAASAHATIDNRGVRR